jgi:hypothetical protein
MRSDQQAFAQVRGRLRFVVGRMKQHANCDRPHRGGPGARPPGPAWSEQGSSNPRAGFTLSVWAGRSTMRTAARRTVGSRGSAPGLEPLDQRRLSDPGLAGDHDQPPLAPPGRGRMLAQRHQRRLPLQQRRVRLGRPPVRAADLADGRRTPRDDVGPAHGVFNQRAPIHAEPASCPCGRLRPTAGAMASPRP